MHLQRVSGRLSQLRNIFSASGVPMFGRNGCIAERGGFRILHDSALRQKMTKMIGLGVHEEETQSVSDVSGPVEFTTRTWKCSFWVLELN